MNRLSTNQFYKRLWYNNKRNNCLLLVPQMRLLLNNCLNNILMCRKCHNSNCCNRKCYNSHLIHLRCLYRINLVSYPITLGHLNTSLVYKPNSLCNLRHIHILNSTLTNLALRHPTCNRQVMLITCKNWTNWINIVNWNPIYCEVLQCLMALLILKYLYAHLTSSYGNNLTWLSSCGSHC